MSGVLEARSGPLSKGSLVQLNICNAQLDCTLALPRILHHLTLVSSFHQSVVTSIRLSDSVHHLDFRILNRLFSDVTDDLQRRLIRHLFMIHLLDLAKLNRLSLPSLHFTDRLNIITEVILHSSRSCESPTLLATLHRRRGALLPTLLGLLFALGLFLLESQTEWFVDRW